MTTDILDEFAHTNPTLADSSRTSTTAMNTTPPMLGSSPVSSARRLRYSSQTATGFSSSRASFSSINQRHNSSGHNDILSILRSIALKPFRTASMNEAVAGGRTSNVISGSRTSERTTVNLLRYRPLSDMPIDQNSHLQTTQAVEDFHRRMGWPMLPPNDETRLKWKTAMKYLIPTKFDVNRSIDLYRTHENLRKVENLDRISINNPHLIREIESSKFFSLAQMPHQPLPIILTISNSNHSISINPLTAQERELIALQALICQLDSATENSDVQENGIILIYDFQQCTGSLFEMNLCKKLLKLLHDNSYPILMIKIFVISPPKWFKLNPKFLVYTSEQIRDFLINQYGYSLDILPKSFGGTSDPSQTGSIRYQICQTKVTHPQSICSSYYQRENSPNKSSNHIVYFHSDLNRTSFSSPSLLAIAAVKPANSQKRGSSSSSDQDKRQRSNESLIEEDDDEVAPSIDRRVASDHRFEDSQLNSTTDMKCFYKSMNENEFLSKTSTEIRQEFRKMPNPSAKDPFAAKEEKNLDKSRYRDVIPGESTRVKLLPDDDDDNDFINANYVTGYNNQNKAYIFTQGPLPSTIKDFWKMIWQENISIIVMTTNLRESGTTKCHPYWPLNSTESLIVEPYQIENHESKRFDSFLITVLTLKKRNQTEIRTIYHLHYQKWPDHGVPTGTKDALEFLDQVNSYRQLTPTTAPILLHCSAGIGRTGTFCAIDIGIKQYLETKTIDIASTVVKMRHERAGSVQTEDQYVFVHSALMDYIKEHQKMNLVDTSISRKIRDESRSRRKKAPPPISPSNSLEPKINSTTNSESKKKGRK